MEFIPICLECENFKSKDKCKYFRKIPDEIKLRIKRCKWYSNGEYELFLPEGNELVNGNGR